MIHNVNKVKDTFSINDEEAKDDKRHSHPNSLIMLSKVFFAKAQMLEKIPDKLNELLNKGSNFGESNIIVI